MEISFSESFYRDELLCPRIYFPRTIPQNSLLAMYFGPIVDFGFFTFIYLFLSFVELGIESRAFSMLGKRCTIPTPPFLPKKKKKRRGNKIPFFT
jgi:hypothetical protein